MSDARLRLVHLHHAVVVVGDRSEIARRPAVHERPRVDARHAPLRHLREFPVAEELQFGEEQRIEIRILRWPARVDVHQRQRFMQVVHDRRMRGVVPVGDRAHRHLRQVDVAVVVVEDVLAPVGQAATAAATSAATASQPRQRRAPICAISSPRLNQSTLRSRPSASATGVTDTYTLSRICEMYGDVSVARR